jgi:peroxiredoxin
VFASKSLTAHLVRGAIVITATTVAGCLPHEKAYDATPAGKVGSAPAGVGLAVGQPAPDIALLDAKGRTVSMLEGTAKGPVLVVFYKGGWCPSCNYQIHELSSSYAEFERRGVSIVAVSVDGTSFASATESEYHVPFPILSDPDLAAHEAYRVVDDVGAVGAFMLARMGADLAKRSGKSHHHVAIPSLFVVDSTHAIRFRHADKDYGTRPSVKQILAAIDAAGLAR